MKKMIAWVLTLMLALALPFGAAAEDVGVITTRIANPVVRIGADAENLSEIDLTGLAVELGAIGKGTGMNDYTAALTAKVFSGENAVLSGVAEFVPGVFTAALEGMAKAVTGKYEMPKTDESVLDLTKFDLEKVMASLDLEKLTATVMAMAPVDAGTGEVAFWDDVTKNAAKSTITVTPEQVQVVLGEFVKAVNASGIASEAIDTAQLSKVNFGADVTLWTSEDGADLRVDAMFNTKSDDSDIALPAVILLNTAEDGVINASFEMIPDGNGVYAVLMLEPSADYEGEFEATFAVSAISDGEEAGGITAYSAPVKEEAGRSDTFVMSLTGADQTVELTSSIYRGKDGARSLNIALDGGDAFGATVDFEGVRAKEKSDKSLSGTLSFTFEAESMVADGSIDVDCSTAAGDDSLLPDFSGYEVVDIESLDDDAREQLGTEATGVLFTALGTLMEIPGVQALMQDMG